MSILRTAVLVIMLATCGPFLSAQQNGGGEAHPDLTTNAASLKRWQEMRFGMFIHWGPITLRGAEIGWSRGPQVRIEDYDGLYKEFNPVLFNAQEWAGLAKAAGMKYLVITSKHHDGFCLWDSKYTTYDIMSTPFRRDVVAELADASRKQGVMFCTYHSILDWHHPDYPVAYGGDPKPIASADMNRYRAYLRNQVTELITKYGTEMLWFDGQWEDPWTHQDGMELYAYARKLKDGLLINNRVDKGHGSGAKGMSASNIYAGDFGTPEQEVGSFDNDHPWESCITIGTQWSWKPNDRIKSLKECLHTLARTAGGGGNLLLNISPMPDGRIEQRQIDRLKGMGTWLKRYGESIYGTKGGPIKPGTWIASTNKGNRVFVHLLTAPKDTLFLPVFPGRTVTKVSVLGGAPLTSRSTEGRLAIPLPAQGLDPDDAVIAFDLDGPASGMPLLEVPENTFGTLQVEKVTLKEAASTKYPGHGAQALTDGMRGTVEMNDTEWMGFEESDCEAILDLGKERKISSVTVGCLQAQGSWIFLPRSVEVMVSMNGTDYLPAGLQTTGEPTDDPRVMTKDLTVSFAPTGARFLKVRAANVAVCPPGHKGAGGKAWLFVDEIIAR
ncbi:MAG: alpha-L-fucosidase [Ignavibacteriae bacterium]|nr:alpha-L-fucosidase [Ignavibacteriota bacterium]